MPSSAASSLTSISACERLAGDEARLVPGPKRPISERAGTAAPPASLAGFERVTTPVDTGAGEFLCCLRLPRFLWEDVVPGAAGTWQLGELAWREGRAREPEKRTRQLRLGAAVR